MTDRPEGLLRWQWAHYEAGHRDRRNLILHALTAPLFQAGTLVLLSAPVLGPAALSGLAAMVLAVAAQGRGHRGEANAPLPFRGPLDVVARIFVEQWITFPRFVATGGFGRAWRDAARAA